MATHVKVIKHGYTRVGGFDDLNNNYEGHMEFFIINHNDDVYVVGMGFNYAEIIDVK